MNIFGILENIQEVYKIWTNIKGITSEYGWESLPLNGKHDVNDVVAFHREKLSKALLSINVVNIFLSIFSNKDFSSNFSKSSLSELFFQIITFIRSSI